MDKAAIFDLDGTLIDSMYVWQYVDEVFLKKRGYIVPPEYGRECAHRSFYETAQYTIELFGLKESPEEIMNEWKALADYEYKTNVRLKPGARELLQALKEKGYRLCICTSLMKPLCTNVMESNGVLSYFDSIVTVDDFGKGKHSPDIYLHISEIIGVPAENCYMFDDVALNLAACKSIGMNTVGVWEPKGGQRKQELRDIADVYIECLFDYLKYIK